MAGRGARLGHRDLSSRPCPSQINRLTRPQVARLCGFKEVEDVFRALRRPQGEKLMI
jgi:hypothetical protein